MSNTKMGDVTMYYVDRNIYGRWLNKQPRSIRPLKPTVQNWIVVNVTAVSLLPANNKSKLLKVKLSDDVGWRQFSGNGYITGRRVTVISVSGPFNKATTYAFIGGVQPRNVRRSSYSYAFIYRRSNPTAFILPFSYPIDGFSLRRARRFRLTSLR